MKALLIALAMLAAGCSTITPVGPGVEVDLLAANDARKAGLWETYKSWWGDHPWITGGVHAGALAAGWIVGDQAGWWGSSGGNNSMDAWHGGDVGGDQSGDRLSINIRGDGNTVTVDNRSTNGGL